MKTIKKLFRYLKRYKKLLTISIISLLIVQFLGLLSPLIVKSILDDYLIKINEPWYESQNNEGVYYNNKYYNQKDINNKQVTIITYNGKYYYIDEKVEVNEGEISLKDDKLLINNIEYNYNLLNKNEVKNFYTPFIHPLKILLILLVIRFFLQILFTYIQRITTSYINVNIVRDARLDAVKALSRMPMSYFDKEPAGKIANRIITDVNGLISLFQTIMNLFLNATLSIVFAYIGMFYLDYKLALFTFIIFPIVYIWIKFFIKKLRKIAEKVNENRSLIIANLNEIINGISILQIYNNEENTLNSFNKLSKEFMDDQLKEQKLHLSIGWNMIRLVGALVTAFIVLYFGSKSLNVLGYVATAGTIYAYNDYLTRLVEPVNTLFREIGNFQHSLVKTERIFAIIDSKQEDFSIKEIDKYQGHIVFDNVWFSYVDNNYVLKGINIEILPGQMVGIVGRTGSGKSTLMSLLLRFYDLKENDMGNIYVDGKNINTYSKRTYRKDIGIILQEPILFKGTIKDNIKFGEDASDEVVYNTLLEVGGKRILDKFSHGINQEVSRNGENLSLGEKQIISFARVLIHNPSILVMDEATANIDTETEVLIQNALNKVKKGRTTIVIAHRLSTIKNADKIIVFEDGKKVEEGTHKELLDNNKVYANIYRSQIKEY